MQGLSIGKLARSANVSIDTIRFYEKSGVLPQPTRLPSGFRRYSPNDVRRLKFVRHARELGLSLQDIAELLALDEVRDDDAAVEAVARQLLAIERKLQQLQRWRTCLMTLRAHWDDAQRASNSILEFFPEEPIDDEATADVATEASQREGLR